MSKIHRLTDEAPSRPTVADVLFIHGLDGDPVQTWTSDTGSDSFWPSWLAEDVAHVDVWSLEYEGWSSRWRGHAMPLQDRGVNVLSLLSAAGLGRRPLLLVCHSLGGLVAKQILFQSAALGSADTGLRQIAANCRGVAFLSTPHSGSDLADLAGRLRRVYRPTTAVRDLESHDAYLRMLGGWFRDNAEGLGLRVLALFETRPTLGVLVVDQTSANPGIAGVTPIPVDADHGGIAKPKDRDDLVYLLVRNWVRDVLDGTAKPDDQPADAAASLTGVGTSPYGDALDRAGTLRSIYDDVLADQVPVSGGWGLAQAKVLEEITGTPVSDFERREAGILSTYLVLDALRRYEDDDEVFRLQPYSLQAMRYLLERQGRDGGFGRNVRSKSGTELHRSLRHTAFAVSALVALGGPAGRISSGLTYVMRHLEAEEWLDDAGPSLAIAGVLHLLHLLENSADFAPYRDYLSVDGTQVETLRRLLSDLAEDPRHAPLWPPYGGHEEMTFDTALETIDLLPKPTPEVLRGTVMRAATHILRAEVDGGIPYHGSTTTPDPGVSALMLWVLTDRLVPEASDSPALVRRLTVSAERLTDYLLQSSSDTSHRRLTYSDTLSFALRLGTRRRR